MKKKWLNVGGCDHLLLKWLRIMKLTLFIFLIGLMHVSASVYAQQIRLSVSMQNASVKEVLRDIEDQSDFFFLYKNDEIDVNRRVDINIKDKSVEEILELIFKGTQVSYEVHDRQIVLMSNNHSQEQKKITVSGKITDSSGTPLPGVTVVVKGTNTGIITDMDGKYVLSNIQGDVTLVFSFVGMKTQEIPVAGKTSINITMEEDAIGLEEVVAIGYGTARRKDLTGSVASVTGASLKDIPVTSAAQAITGRMAGVQVTQTEGSPDAEIKIRVRGGGSITQDNSPLYIVDGFPVESISDIAPTDIESIDILKDASSTAIYGARGANGVILITTKGGSDIKGKISYNTYFGIKNITKLYDMLDPYEYVFYQYEALNGNTLLTERYYGDFNDFGLYKQMKGKNWEDEILGNTGTSMYHNLAFAGGSASSKYSFSITRNDEKEVMMGSGYDRTNFMTKTMHKVNKWLTLDFNARLSNYNLEGAGTSSDSRFTHITQYRPVDGFADFVDYLLTDDDFETSSLFILNPLKQTEDDYRREKRLNFNFNGAATIQITKDINYRFEYGYQYEETTKRRFYGLNTSNAIAYGSMPLASIAKTDLNVYRLSNVLNYTKKNILPGSNVSVMLGEELYNYKTDVVTTSAKYFPKYIDAVGALSMMQLGTPDPTQTADNPANKISSFFGRVNYDYKGRYLASASIRADGSSKFAPGNQWGYFPSLGVAWRISDEHFMANTEKWLDDLKLRTSYGEAGNNRISDNAWQKTFSVKTGQVCLEGDESTQTAFLNVNGILSNPKLKWETTVTRNIGADFSLFKQRLSGSLEMYKNTTRNLLIRATVPSNTGYTTQWQNIGQTSNKGLEIVLNGIIINNKDFKLSASCNIGFNRNKIDKLGEAKSWEESAGIGVSGDYLIKEEEQVGLMYGYVTEGMYSFDDFDYNYKTETYTLKEGVADDHALLVGKFMPGTLKLKDTNGDFVVNADDKMVIGNANPKHTGGFNLTAQYKGFDFSAFFNWVYGNDIYNANKLQFTSFYQGRYFKNVQNIVSSENRFMYFDKSTGERVDDPEQLAELNKNATIWSPLSCNLIQLHSWVVEDGSFLRLNNLTIGYSLPQSITNKLKIESLRIYATGYNLWLWTKYSGYDPEVDTRRSTPLTPGVDFCAYPRSRNFNIGLNIKF